MLKMFTMFESESICSMYLLTKLFGSVDVFKPATSKEGNSEVYVICRLNLRMAKNGLFLFVWFLLLKQFFTV